MLQTWRGQVSGLFSRQDTCPVQDTKTNKKLKFREIVFTMNVFEPNPEVKKVFEKKCLMEVLWKQKEDFALIRKQKFLHINPGSFIWRNESVCCYFRWLKQLQWTNECRCWTSWRQFNADLWVFWSVCVLFWPKTTWMWPNWDPSASVSASWTTAILNSSKKPSKHFNVSNPDIYRPSIVLQKCSRKQISPKTALSVLHL